ncbi:hypothetical protein VPNG_00806 [Cytospora leucostoma]|uniref:FAD dependent oxidoreductase domain-containing protein n=1 Tax=Cytospora leucostoma TaxID=1230097 RepID=A0A423XMS2_9PEZI|nr:hypothetical protein VPNG_00806 [Cytospora leucostoma]
MAADQSSHAMLPVPNPTPSYWRSEPHYLDSHRSTPELPDESDIIIIGAGLAGVSVAYHLSNAPDPPSILLLEARQTCSGATGRNGGHTKAKTTTLMNLAKTSGGHAAEEMSRFVRAQIYALKDAVEKEHIDCEFELRRSYDVFRSEGDARRTEASWRRDFLGGQHGWTEDVQWLGPGLAERLTSVRGARGAFSVPACSFWPYKLVTGLLERSVARNGRLNLQTETPVLRVQQAAAAGGGGGGGGGNVVHTARGVVRAKKVVFATNAYAAALLPEYRGVITPYKGTAAHLAVEDGAEPVFPHLSHTYNIDFGSKQELDTVDYLNPRPDGGIVVGGAKWIYEKQKDLWYNTVDDSTLVQPVMEAEYFEGYMQRTFRGWKDSGTEVDKVWTGNGVPHVGKVPQKEAQWILAGFNGGGNALVYLCAKAVANMALHDLSFRESGVDVPSFFESTKERLLLA